MAKNVRLGSRVRDRISGFEGVAYGRHEYLSGCNKITIAPVGRVSPEGKPIEMQWFDEQQIEVVGPPKFGEFVDETIGTEADDRTGGPSDMPRRAL